MSTPRVFQVLLWLATVMVCTLGSMLIYISWIAAPWLEYTNLPFPVLAQQLRPGDKVPIIVGKCNSADTVMFYSTTPELVRVDDVEAFSGFDNIELSLKPGCIREINRDIKLPDDTEDGLYIIKGQSKVLGVFRDRLIPWYSEAFKVAR